MAIYDGPELRTFGNPWIRSNEYKGVVHEVYEHFSMKYMNKFLVLSVLLFFRSHELLVS